MTASALEVWGDPIAHSLSPVLHTAAYAHLGIPWTYGRRRVDERTFPRELAGLDRRFRGLSCTMPLKGLAFAAADTRDDRAKVTRAANTLLVDGSALRAFNTDVGGIVRALADAGVTRLDSARIVGAGATATSALVAAHELGAREIEVVARRPAAAAALTTLGESLGVRVAAVPFAAAQFAPHAVTMSTLPGDALVDPDVAAALASHGGLLFDVVYGHWPTTLASAWMNAGRDAVSGQGMLLHQALLQIRIFATGDVNEPLPDETSVVDVMRNALVGG